MMCAISAGDAARGAGDATGDGALTGLSPGRVTGPAGGRVAIVGEAAGEAAPVTSGEATGDGAARTGDAAVAVGSVTVDRGAAGDCPRHAAVSARTTASVAAHPATRGRFRWIGLVEVLEIVFNQVDHTRDSLLDHPQDSGMLNVGVALAVGDAGQSGDRQTNAPSH